MVRGRSLRTGWLRQNPSTYPLALREVEGFRRVFTQSAEGRDLSYILRVNSLARAIGHPKFRALRSQVIGNQTRSDSKPAKIRRIFDVSHHDLMFYVLE
jgi:hypothetical protein